MIINTQPFTINNKLIVKKIELSMESIPLPVWIVVFIRKRFFRASFCPKILVQVALALTYHLGDYGLHSPPCDL